MFRKTSKWLVEWNNNNSSAATCSACNLQIEKCKFFLKMWKLWKFHQKLPFFRQFLQCNLKLPLKIKFNQKHNIWFDDDEILIELLIMILRNAPIINLHIKVKFEIEYLRLRRPENSPSRVSVCAATLRSRRTSNKLIRWPPCSLIRFRCLMAQICRIDAGRRRY